MGGEKSVGTPGLVPREKLPSKIIRREQARAFWDMRFVGISKAAKSCDQNGLIDF